MANLVTIYMNNDIPRKIKYIEREVMEICSKYTGQPLTTHLSQRIADEFAKRFDTALKVDSVRRDKNGQLIIDAILNPFLLEERPHAGYPYGVTTLEMREPSPWRPQTYPMYRDTTLTSDPNINVGSSGGSAIGIRDVFTYMDSSIRYNSRGEAVYPSSKE